MYQLPPLKNIFIGLSLKFGVSLEKTWTLKNLVNYKTWALKNLVNYARGYLFSLDVFSRNYKPEFLIHLVKTSTIQGNG